MGKLIAKTAAYTLAAVIAAALILFGVVSLAAPSAMASFTDALGMDGACACYSVEAADRSGATDDLALAAERSYAAEHYEDAAACGTRLLGAADFADYCASRDAATAGSSLIGGSYAQYAAGITASAQYYIGGEGGSSFYGDERARRRISAKQCRRLPRRCGAGEGRRFLLCGYSLRSRRVFPVCGRRRGIY